MKFHAFIAATSIAFITFYSCQKSTESTSTNGTSQVKIRMTDAPFNAQQVNIDLKEVRISYRKDSAWSTLQTNAGIYNLLQYQNGLDTLIGSGSMPTDSTIKELRLILGINNTIMIDSVIHPLTILGGSESGLKIKVGKKASRTIEEILVDFDANLSIHKTGNGQYLLKPVLKLK